MMDGKARLDCASSARLLLFHDRYSTCLIVGLTKYHDIPFLLHHLPCNVLCVYIGI